MRNPILNAKTCLFRPHSGSVPSSSVRFTGTKVLPLSRTIELVKVKKQDSVV